jgi:hypothetical protein
MINLGKFGGLINAACPTIATASGGPVAGIAVKALSTALLGHGDGSRMILPLPYQPRPRANCRHPQS